MLSQAPTHLIAIKAEWPTSSIAESAELSAIDICHRETMTRVVLPTPAR
jgi:hypothetical protein